MASAALAACKTDKPTNVADGDYPAFTPECGSPGDSIAITSVCKGHVLGDSFDGVAGVKFFPNLIVDPSSVTPNDPREGSCRITAVVPDGAETGRIAVELHYTDRKSTMFLESKGVFSIPCPASSDPDAGPDASPESGPSPTCGDGALQEPEACDPGTPGVACSGGLVCTEACACEVPPDYGEEHPTGDLKAPNGDPAGAAGDPSVDITRSETYVDPVSGFAWVRLCVAGAFPPASTFYSWFLKITLLRASDGGHASFGSFTIERHDGVDRVPEGSIPTAHVAEANCVKVRFDTTEVPARYEVESGLLKTSTGTFVSDRPPGSTFTPTQVPW